MGITIIKIYTTRTHWGYRALRGSVTTGPDRDVIQDLGSPFPNPDYFAIYLLTSTQGNKYYITGITIITIYEVYYKSTLGTLGTLDILGITWPSRINTTGLGRDIIQDLGSPFPNSDHATIYVLTSTQGSKYNGLYDHYSLRSTLQDHTGHTEHTWILGITWPGRISTIRLGRDIIQDLGSLFPNLN